MNSTSPGYVRSLRPWDAALIVVGGVIGGGIFLNPGIVAQRTESGLALLLMWVAAGLLTLIGALCYAELGARRPHAGGTYVYLREAYGPLAGFLFGRSEEHTSELQSLMRISYAVLGLKNKNKQAH